jgi:PTS system nitrogen regulatory IIA component
LFSPLSLISPKEAPPMTDDPLMSVREIAAYLNVNISTIYMWSQKGQIPAMKIGTMWRYRRSEIEDWLNQRRTPAIEQDGAARGVR